MYLIFGDIFNISLPYISVHLALYIYTLVNCFFLGFLGKKKINCSQSA